MKYSISPYLIGTVLTLNYDMRIFFKFFLKFMKKKFAIIIRLIIFGNRLH